MSKKGQGISIEFIIIAAIALIVLIVIILFFTGGLEKIFGGQSPKTQIDSPELPTCQHCVYPWYDVHMGKELNLNNYNCYLVRERSEEYLKIQLNRSIEFLNNNPNNVKDENGFFLPCCDRYYPFSLEAYCTKEKCLILHDDICEWVNMTG